jgi:hypothetical protein
LLRGGFDELFFSCILHSLKQNVTDGALHQLIRRLFAQLVIRIAKEP